MEEQRKKEAAATIVGFGLAKAATSLGYLSAMGSVGQSVGFVTELWFMFASEAASIIVASLVIALACRGAVKPGSFAMWPGVAALVAGFAASTYMRGLKFGFVSTTLLGQVDASVGGKNGVNVDGYKNMAGTFTQPQFVICDPGMLRTLPDREFRAGLAEVVKAAIIADADLFERIEGTTFEALRADTDLLTDAVSAAIRVKADIVERDERESGDRRKLNLGHTLAHAIEKCSNRMNHGEAVAVGTALIAGAAVKLGALTQADCDRIVNVLTALGFDLTPPVEVKRLLKEGGKDKKNEDGMLRIVLPVGIGDCEVRPMTMDAFAALF